jgi:hypothetical protein
VDKLPDKGPRPFGFCIIPRLRLSIFQAITMIAPDTAPQILSVFEIPAPKPQAIFFAVPVSSPSSSENAENTAEEQVNPFLKPARASSDFVMNTILIIVILVKCPLEYILHAVYTLLIFRFRIFSFS